jgi:predicted amidohydrolase YtcJ
MAWLRAPRVSLLLCLLGTACSQPGADLVFRGGGVYTVDADRSWAEAVAVDGGRIVYVGSDPGVASFVGSRTEIVELEGRMLLPGLQDSHVHPPLGMILEALCRLDEAATREAILERVRVCVAESSGEWVLGFGWRSSIFLPEVAPQRADLDAIEPNRPVVLIAKDMHTFWLNSRALVEVGITRDTPTPEGGEIVRDPETGEPSGALRDFAVEPVVRAIPRPGPIESLQRLRAAIREMNRHGYTSFMDARVEDRATAWAYRLLELLDLLDARVSLAILLDPRRDRSQLEEIRGIREDFSTRRIDARIVKIFVDGGTAVRSAASRPYRGGLSSADPYIDGDRLAEYVTELDRLGFAVHLHTLGDRATRIALDAIAQARRDNPSPGPRHAVTHLVYPHPEDIPRFRELDVIANVSPSWAFPNEWSGSFPPVLGPKRAAWMYPFRSLLDSGALVTAGSDHPFTPLNPFLAIETGITRRDPLGAGDEALVEEQGATLDALLAAYTINAAHQLHQEELTGSIEVGKAGDLVVLDRNLFDSPPREISETRVLMTVLDGEVIHRAESWDRGAAAR